jgi:hypothetical protein
VAGAICGPRKAFIRRFRRWTQIQARYPTVENWKTKKNLPADHPDEADEEERMSGHKKHEEPQKEDRQVLLFVSFRVLCGHLSSLRGQVLMTSTWLRRLSPSARMCLPAVAGEICGQKSVSIRRLRRLTQIQARHSPTMIRSASPTRQYGTDPV